MAERAAGGYPADLFVDDVDDDLECPICMLTLREPIACAEGHTMCRSCAAAALEAKPECPTCKCELTLATAVKSRPLLRVIDKLAVRCTHHGAGEGGGSDAGCAWTGKLGDLAGHLQRDCGFVAVACRYIGCRLHESSGRRRLLRRDVAAHEASCAYRTAACALCTRMVRVSEMERHVGLKCPQRPVTCRSGLGARGRSDSAGGMLRRGDNDDDDDGCGVVMPLSELDEHRKIKCPRVRVNCAVPGCDARPRRSDVAAHMEAAATAHEVIGLRRETQALARQLASTTAQLHAVTERLDATSMELRDRDAEPVFFKFDYPTRYQACRFYPGNWITYSLADILPWHSSPFVRCGTAWQLCLVCDLRQRPTKEPPRDGAECMSVTASIKHLRVYEHGSDPDSAAALPPSLEARVTLLAADNVSPLVTQTATWDGATATKPFPEVIEFDGPITDDDRTCREKKGPRASNDERYDCSLRFRVTMRRLGRTLPESASAPLLWLGDGTDELEGDGGAGGAAGGAGGKRRAV
mmetsp:Transcript_15747/g.54678  ORF Transcript_15747/g.54678 Transcript_15747/m.54678 type:complete len:524 (-) Transcript_15747:260-1831(-)